MKTRWIKYDWHIFYDQIKNQIIILKWDYGCNGVSHWWHFNGQKCGSIKGKLKTPKHWVRIDREFEGVL